MHIACCICKQVKHTHYNNLLFFAWATHTFHHSFASVAWREAVERMCLSSVCTYCRFEYCHRRRLPDSLWVWYMVYRQSVLKKKKKKKKTKKTGLLICVTTKVPNEKKYADHFLTIALCSDRYQKFPIIIIISVHNFGSRTNWIRERKKISRSRLGSTTAQR